MTHASDERPYTVIGLSLPGDGLAVAGVAQGHPVMVDTAQTSYGLARWTLQIWARNGADAERQACDAWEHLATGSDALIGDQHSMDVEVRQTPPRRKRGAIRRWLGI